MKKLKIFPSIGIARIGNSEEFFLCPENEDSVGSEFDNIGKETEIKDFKVSGLVKKQGARFRLYEESEDGQYYEYQLPEGAVIHWTVRLVNKKTATERTDPNIFFQNGNRFYPPIKAPSVVPLKDNSADLIIDSKDVSISEITSFQNKVPLIGKIKVGENEAKQVKLGCIFTDISNNLIVLGGSGIAEGTEDITNFYTNDSWYDDTSDGYIKASIQLPGMDSPITAEGAWIIVAPTDFAPALKGVVSLYDQLLDVAINTFHFPLEQPKSFKLHIEPLIRNYMNIKWVEEDIKFDIPYTFTQLSNNSIANKQLRKKVMDKILDIPLDGHPGNGRKFLYTDTQIRVLTDWVNGNFNDDYTELSSFDKKRGDYLTATALRTTVGQGFFPGIEGGIILCNPSIYSSPFTIDHSSINPGDITGLMALPWQADFLECADDWWPTQRPFQIRPNINDIEEVDEWQRPMGNDSGDYASLLIKNIHRLAFIKAKESQNGIVYVEDERDFTLIKKTDLLT